MSELSFSHDIFSEHLQTAADRLALAARSPATLRAYHIDWGTFVAWYRP